MKNEVSFEKLQQRKFANKNITKEKIQVCYHRPDCPLIFSRLLTTIEIEKWGNEDQMVWIFRKEKLRFIVVTPKKSLTYLGDHCRSRTRGQCYKEICS